MKSYRPDGTMAKGCPGSRIGAMSGAMSEAIWPLSACSHRAIHVRSIVECASHGVRR